MNDEVGIANLLSNLGAIFYNQGDDAKALEYYLESLRLAEKTNNKLRITTALINIGAVYFNKEATHDKALTYYEKAVKLAEELGDKDAIGTTAVNMGEIYLARGNDSLAMQAFQKARQALENSENLPSALNGIGKVYLLGKDYDNALKYHRQAFNISSRLNSQLDVSYSLIGIGDTYFSLGEYSASLEAYKRAELIARELQAGYILKNAYTGISKSYDRLKDYKNAFRYEQLVSSIKDTLFNIETSKKLMALQSDFEIEKKQAQIDLLTKGRELQELELQKQKLAKNSLIFGLILIFIIAFIILRNNRIKSKTNQILDRQKAEIEKLLENILPMEVAQELQSNGSATPRYYENVTVMFTDFKDFTKLADKFTPQELVAELNDCFIAFDAIIEKYGLEKIKTIGDAYMCAGGIPSEDEQHPMKIIEASLEILQYIYWKNEQRKSMNLPAWELRVGVHSGPLVAGVVGRKKYAYDIWGNTVNIANRMESNGVPGFVNISAATYELIKSRYDCSYRGKIYAKNVGEIDMYFVSNPIQDQRVNAGEQRMKTAGQEA